MAMKKKAPAKKKASASGSDRGAKTKAAEAKRKQQTAAGSDRKLKEKNRQGELAYLRKGPVSTYAATGQMVTDMSELKRLKKRLAKMELELKAREAKTVKRKER